MSKVSQRPKREEIKKQRKEKEKVERALRIKQKAEGLKLPSKAAIPNRKCTYKTVEEEPISGPWLDPLWVKRRLAAPFQLRLI